MVLVIFAIYFILDDLLFYDIRKWLDESIHQRGISHLLTYLLTGTPIFIGILFLHKKNDFFNSLGLNKSILEGFIFSLICTLPMFVGFAFFLDFNTKITPNVILINVIAAAVFEELYYRSFLFGQLFRYTQFGFILSVLLGAVLFGLIHLYQGNELMEWIGVFLITFIGGILFAWVYTEWNYNLWIPIFLHLFMNIAFEIFSAGENALGGLYLNVFRSITVILIIVLTVVYKKKKKKNLIVNKQALWMK